ncbi:MULTISPECIES: hypothetical protein [Rhizobium]|uniref:O-antigen ligase domain-containing protein n=1 Tax=Rhizobium wuzhouense TaxID=1986026 RepID=A0ABX5NL21_9HYPH|nr:MULTISPECIES: hypothetical protein [Rhizobium]PYB70425.1 hypothetical protein DMY87_21210 [Rhizobium wuzhouense]RKE77551.1 hypothetical protein DFO46_4519 [Rhizobium sp. AG855]
MDFVSIILFWVLLLAAILSRGPFIFYLLFGSMAFGSFAVIPPELTQGLSFTPPPIIALVIVFMYGGGTNGLARMLSIALRPSQCLFLTLFWIVAIWTTLFMPRMFAGMVTIIPMRLEEATNGEPLYPTPQNISQIMYLSISVLTVFACALAFRASAIRQHVLGALCIGAVMVIVTGMLDLAGLGPYLDMFRTATYVYLTDVEIANVKRVVGLMPEASAFGSLAVGFLTAIYFLRRAIARPWLRLIGAPCLIVLLTIFALLSTSSTAYGGLAVFGAVAGAEWLWRLLTAAKGSRAREGLVLEFWALILAVGAVYLLALFNAAVFDPFLELVNTIVFQKASSDSFEERSMWTVVSLKALFDTWGLGVGMGGTRASNGLVAVFSNTGLIGGFLYYGFMIQTFLRRAAPGDDEGAVILTAVRFYMPPVLIMGILAGTSADFGIMNACIYALAAATAMTVPVKSGAATNPSRRRSAGTQRLV